MLSVARTFLRPEKDSGRPVSFRLQKYKKMPIQLKKTFNLQYYAIFT